MSVVPYSESKFPLSVNLSIIWFKGPFIVFIAANEYGYGVRCEMENDLDAHYIIAQAPTLHCCNRALILIEIFMTLLEIQIHN